MSFAKVRFGEDMVWEIKGFDINGKKIEEWKVMNKDFPDTVKILSKKYGFKIYVKEQGDNLDLEWAI